MAIPALTTESKVRIRLSTLGVNLRIDHDPQPASGIMADVIGRASSEAAGYLSRYPLVARDGLPGLGDSGWVSDMVADIAIYHLCRYRANPFPASVKEIYENVIDMLRLVQAGKMNVPDLSNAAGAPAIVNYGVRDDVYPHKRRLPSRSNPVAPTGFPSYPDRREPRPYG